MRKIWLTLGLLLAGFSPVFGQEFPLNGTIPILFSTYNSNGDFTDADSLPTCTVLPPGTNTPIFNPTVVSRGTAGKYRASVPITVANGFAVGTIYAVECNATVASKPGSVVKQTFRVHLAETIAGAFIVDTRYLNGTLNTARDIGASVIVGTNNDKSGYSLTQAFPPNFAAFLIDASGRTQQQYGTLTGQINCAAGVCAANVTQFGGTNGTFASGIPSVNAATIADKIGYALTAAYDPAKTTAQQSASYRLPATSQGGTTANIRFDAGASSTNGFYVGRRVFIVGGTGLDQVRIVASYIGATRTAIVDRPFVVAPDNTSQFVVLPN